MFSALGWVEENMLKPHGVGRKKGLGGGELDEDWDVLLACKKKRMCVWAISQQTGRLECKGWHSCRNCPHTRILAAAHSHVSHWCARLVPCLGSARR